MPAEPGRVLVVGDLATDVVASIPVPLADGSGLAIGTDTQARIGLSGGGSAANTASWLASLGTPVTLVAAAGDDEAGTARLAELHAAGVDCLVRRHRQARTGAVVVLSDPAERTMLCDRGANRLLAVEQVTDAIRTATDAAHLHLSGYPLFDEQTRPAGRAALSAAAAAGLATSVDAASSAPLRRLGAATFAELIGGVDLLLANLDEARVLVGRAAPAGVAARELTELAATVVVKLGAEGAVLADADGLHEAPAVPVTAVDATGAGDAFAAGLLAALRSGATPVAALRAGAALGARAVGDVGARPRPPATGR